MDFLTLAKERYSCRKFSGKEVEQEKLEKIMEAGIAAPTAVNKQPYKIWLMQSEKARKAIYEVTRFTFEADIFFVVGYLEEEAWVRKYDGRNFADVDASIVATQMMLEIQDLGLGTTWVGHFDAPRLKKSVSGDGTLWFDCHIPCGIPGRRCRAGSPSWNSKG